MPMIIIGLGTIFLVWFTWWASLKERRYHGITRFISFESLLLLITANASLWFADPFRPVQLASWLLLMGSIYLAAQGFYLLNKVGHPQGQMENTSVLITGGLYRLIRHPLYASLILLGLGAWLKSVNWISTFLAMINMAALYFTSRIEEGEMTCRFGPAYQDYMRKTKRFIPFIF